ncbi:hypothetical protein Pyn_00643 [Prunus yedoensis var. nudiflora]|uniref:Uncharacterized protein n=1 Tax=Prunus yedoensis var. nudiflora TaxID=2094558 RepID=A0A314YT95_PRUYE|nr:hypothetical protein Pyn_00643 [Prunus yedoensis var. nudiflora]
MCRSNQESNSNITSALPNGKACAETRKGSHIPFLPLSKLQGSAPACCLSKPSSTNLPKVKPRPTQKAHATRHDTCLALTPLGSLVETELIP